MSDNVRLRDKTEAALEALGEGFQSVAPRNQTPRSQPRPTKANTGVGRDNSGANRAALGAQLKAKILAAEKSGNVDVATKLRKQLAALLTAK